MVNIMNKDEVYNFIKDKGIWYEVTEHKAVYSMDDLKDVELPYREGNAKNLFVRDDKKKNYYLIMVREEKRVNLSLFRKEFNTRPLTFASSEDLERILGLYPGAASPLGLLNDNERKVKFYLDIWRRFLFYRIIENIRIRFNFGFIWINL